MSHATLPRICKLTTHTVIREREREEDRREENEIEGNGWKGKQKGSGERGEVEGRFATERDTFLRLEKFSSLAGYLDKALIRGFTSDGIAQDFYGVNVNSHFLRFRIIPSFFSIRGPMVIESLGFTLLRDVNARASTSNIFFSLQRRFAREFS